jgi:hypothetical protein
MMSKVQNLASVVKQDVKKDLKLKKAKRKGKNPRPSFNGGKTMGSTMTGYASNKLSSGVRVQSVPVSFGVASFVPNFSHAGLPDKSDYDPRYGIKIKVLEMSNISIVSGASGDGCLRVGSGLGGNTQLTLTPAVLFAQGSRVRLYAGIYGFYVYRSIKLLYVPMGGSTTVGIFALGFIENFDASVRLATSVPNLWNAMQCESPMLSSMWSQGSSTEYVHKGVKAFSTIIQSGTSPLEDNIQVSLIGVSEGLGFSTQYGKLFVEAEIDFYSPQTYITNIAVDEPSFTSSLKGRPSIPVSSKGAGLDEEEKHDDRELVVVRQSSSRSSSVPPLARSTEVERASGGGWFQTSTPRVAVDATQTRIK